MATPHPLDPGQLYKRCDPDGFDFETTAELESLSEIVGQDRALDALEFGAEIRSSGYNIFVTGPNGVGKHTVVQRFLNQRAAERDTPSDWCYIHNFDDPNKPRLLRLAAGRGQELRRDLDQLVDDFRSAIPATFESEEYQGRMEELNQQLSQRQEQAFREIQEEAEKKNVAVVQTPQGLSLAPRKDGEIMDPEEFQKLPEEERKRWQEIIEELQQKLQNVIRQVPRWRKEGGQQARKINEEMADYAVGHLIDEMIKKYENFPEVKAHLKAIREDVVGNVDAFRRAHERRQQAPRNHGGDPVTDRYRVNCVVDNGQQSGAPVVYEDFPTYQHLVGRIEHYVDQGALMTDFSYIRPGALHRANGGYLVLDARKLLMQPFAWEGLKRALYSRELAIESPQQLYSVISTVSLEPQAMPLDLKVVLVGEPLLYYLLAQYDPDFPDLFKVQADFEEDLDRTDDNQRLYARLLGTMAAREDLRPLNRGAVARLIERGSRLVDDGERITAHAREIADLLRESEHWAAAEDAENIEAAHVQKAIDKQVYRGDRIHQRMKRAILRETILIDTEGKRRGQVNGLAVYQLGNTRFGRPSRITATTRLGTGKVVDIERESELGGSIHSKGVMILSSFLSARYIPDRAFSLNASLTFEQSYGPVEGDSASVAELCALLSSLADAPLRQDMAVTGSVNQHGQVQAIGGVNEKIEGFFDVCTARGLTGNQGVIIPRANVPHLMLRSDVRHAAEEGRFHVYAAEHVDEVLTLLTNLDAGEADDEGRFPEDSLNGRIAARLEQLAELSHRERRSGGDNNGKE